MHSSPSPPAVEGAAHPVSWFPVVVFGLVWVELISRLRFEWSINPQYAYGWTVPFLAAYVFWKRYQHAPAPTRPAYRVLSGTLIFLAALVLIPTRLVQEANPDWRLLSWLMALAAATATASGIYLAGGRSWLRHFAFPLLFFFVAVPWPTGLEQAAIQGLMRADAWINVEILNAIGIPAVQLGNVIEIGTGFVGIDEACTGIRSLQATLMVSLFLGEFYELSGGRRVALVVAGAIMAFVCNVVRTFLLVWAGVKEGSEGIKNWHDPAGYTILTLCLLGLWGMCLFLQHPNLASPTLTLTPAGWRLPRFALGFLLGGLVLAEAGTQFWYRSQGSSERPQPWTVVWPADANNWKEIPIAESAQDLLRYNEGGGGAWNAGDGHKWNMYFFRWLPGRTAGLFVRNHRPDICLPASGMKQRGQMQSKILTVNEVPLSVRTYVFDNDGRSLHVFYCYWDGTTPEPGATDHEDWTPLGRLDAVRKAKRDVGSQMLEIIGWGYDNDQEAEQAAIAELSKIIKRT